MEYRSFQIEPSYMSGYDFAHDEYDGAPDAGDCFYNRVGHESTIQKCKDAIDQRYAEATEYRIITRTEQRQFCITKFWYLQDAINFFSKVGGEFQMIVNGEVQNFDSI
jgi:hypothetical protein